MKVKIQDIVIKNMLLIAFFTLFSQFSLISTINRILAFVLIALLVVSTFNNTEKKGKSVLIFLFAILLVIWSLYKTVWPIKNFNEIIYFPLWILIFNNFYDKYDTYEETLNNNINNIKTLILFWNIFVFISLIVPSSYTKSAFCSFSGSPHRFATCAFIIFVFEMLIYKKTNKKMYFYFSILSLIYILLSGARTYMVVCSLSFLTNLYAIINSKKKFVLLFIVIIIIGGFFLNNLNIMKERQTETERLTQLYKGDSIRAITSGRSVWWKIDLEHYSSEQPLNKILGCGYHYVRYINSNYYGQEIWAHNDYIQLLLTNGIFSIVLYLYVYFRFIRQAYNYSNKTKKIKYLLLFVSIITLFNAVFNMVYTYTCAVFSTLILTMLVTSKKIQKK